MVILFVYSDLCVCLFFSSFFGGGRLRGKISHAFFLNFVFGFLFFLGGRVFRFCFLFFGVSWRGENVFVGCGLQYIVSAKFVTLFNPNLVTIFSEKKVAVGKLWTI